MEHIMNKTSKSRIACFILAFLLLSISFVSAASKDLEKEYYFTSNSDKNFSYAAKEEIKVDGTKYQLVGIRYEVVGENEKYIGENVVFENLNSQEVPKEKVFTIDGKDMTLKLDAEGIEYTEITNYVTDTFEKYIARPSIPNTKIVNENGVAYTAMLSKVKDEDTKKAYTAKVRFVGVEGSTYYLNDKALSMGASAPLWDGYESDVISYLGLPKETTVTSGKWTSGYVNEGEDVARYAEFSGMRPAKNYIATYSYPSYSCEVKYTNGEDQYKIKAICMYEKAGLSTAQKIAVGAGIVIFAGLVVLILYIIAKRRKDAENDD